MKLGPNGSFSIDGVPAGSYSFLVQVFSPPEDGCLVTPLSVHVEAITIADRRRSQDLGTLKLRKNLATPIGEVLPEIDLEGMDGRPIRVSEMRGKIVLIDVWASWCGPCLEQVPRMRELFERYGADARCVILGLSLDQERDDALAAIGKHRFEWKQCLVSSNNTQRAMSALGCSSVPAYLVLDRKGVLIYRGPKLDTAQDVLEAELSKDSAR